MADLLSATQDQKLSGRFEAVRLLTDELSAPLSAEDQTVQSMPDVSPTKWHRAHTSWFFETFLLVPFLGGYRAFDPAYGFLFNSYYEGVGARHPRPERGLLSRPGIDDIARYRAHVDQAMAALFDVADERIESLVELGIHHEQQHQELLLMDIKHVLSCNPTLPSYRTLGPAATSPLVPSNWTAHPGGMQVIGHRGDGFGFDNEFPRHPVYLEPFALRDELVTCGEWMEFIDDHGYHRPDLWLSDGWATIQAECWEAPLYWWRADGEWQEFTLGGPTPIDPGRPVCHVSYYEADAFARWAGARLPSEAEWEVAAERMNVDAVGSTDAGGANDGARSAVATPHVLDREVLHPLAPEPGRRPSLLGDVWQWTSSAYGPYPGFAPAPGAVGEYNGKFMVNQYVLRGGSCATPPGHVRTTYRNFFPPAARWPFTGLRIAASA
jgi:ergothioneine biosynthesis protein EgtB